VQDVENRNWVSNPQVICQEDVHDCAIAHGGLETRCGMKKARHFARAFVILRIAKSRRLDGYPSALYVARSAAITRAGEL
jgi:hypothetical protein